MSKEEKASAKAPNFRYDETGNCEDCKHIEWKYIGDPKGIQVLAHVCNLYDFCVPSPVSFYKCNSWEWET